MSAQLTDTVRVETAASAAPDRRVNPFVRAGLLVLALLVVLALPWYIYPPVAMDILAWGLFAISVDLLLGFTGLLNFGMAGFMAIGAYSYAISILSFGLPWWVAILVSVAAAVVFALILGIPTLRLRGDYLAIVTIAAAEIVRLLFQTQQFDRWTNSADGLGGYHSGFRAANPLPDSSDGRPRPKTGNASA